jgi:L,D-transpeptidase YcbB
MQDALTRVEEAIRMRIRAFRFTLLLLFAVLVAILRAKQASNDLSVQDEVRALASQAVFPELHWPNFSDYRVQVQKFYELTAYAPAWIEGRKPTQQAVEMTTVFREAGTKGLDPADYDGLRWPARVEKLGSASTTDLARFDLAMTVSVMRYLSDLHLGRVNPRYFHFGFDVAHNKYDLASFVRERLVTSLDVDAALATVEPPFDGYSRTEKALNLYLRLAQQDDGKQLPIPKRPVAVGDRYSGTPLLRGKLCLLGDLQASACSVQTAELYTPFIAEGVTHFQNRYGPQPNGNLDQATIRELNVPLRQRVAVDAGALALAAP